MYEDVSVKSFPASYGESFLVSCNGEGNTVNMLIDTGFLSTAKIICKELEKIKNANQKLDLIILTHIDNDHINGAREVLKQIFEENIVEIGEIWYNDYFKIFDCADDNNEQKEMTEKDKSILNSILNKPYPKEKNDYQYNKVGFKSAQYIEQYLCDSRRKVKWNNLFDEKCIMINHDIVRKKINDKVNIVVINPVLDILRKEFNDWKNYLRDKGFQSSILKKEELALAFERTLLEYEKKSVIVKEKKCGVNEYNQFENCINFNEKDDGIINRSSISIVIEFCGKKLMFLGDGSPIELEDSIQKYIVDIKDENMDLIKVPHHGSKNNWSIEMNKLVKSSNYIIATNGKIFNHPDIETIVKLITSSDQNKKIYFNYKPEKIIAEVKKIEEIKYFPYEFICENDKWNEKKIQEIVI